MALALMVASAAGVAERSRSPNASLHWSASEGLARFALATAIAVYTVLVSGVLVSRPGALMRCLNWPGIVGLARPDDIFGWLYLLRFGVGVLASLMIATLFSRAWKARRDRPRLARDTAVAGVILIAATTVGALIPTPDNGILMPALSMALAAALWAVLVTVVLRAGRNND
jgi:heme A synthase